MMNLGGPATLDEVEPFLLELFADREIIQLPFQRWLGPFIARRRTPKVRGPVRQHRRRLADPALHRGAGRGAWCERLDRLSPETAPHQFYVAFRYVAAEERGRAPRHAGRRRRACDRVHPVPAVLLQHDGLEPQRALARGRRTGLRDAFEWSIIDRWPVHDGFIDAMTETVREGC